MNNSSEKRRGNYVSKNWEYFFHNMPNRHVSIILIYISHKEALAWSITESILHLISWQNINYDWIEFSFVDLHDNLSQLVDYTLILRFYNLSRVYNAD
jgi:hypothetical protein